MQFGQFEMTPLLDARFRLDGGAMFGVVPKPLWERRAPADDRNRIAMSVRPLLVRTGSLNVLIDAGIGDKMSEKEIEIYAIDRTEHLDRSLAAAGLTPRDIDMVVASHLHFDHAGGFTTLVDGVPVPRFPRARYVIRRGEWEDAMHPHERNRASYFAENYAPLERAGVVDFMEADGEVLPGLGVWRTGGHTRHHQAIRIVSDGRTAVFAADLMPTTAHVDPAWIMGYDLYPMDTLAAKKALIAEALANEYVIFFEHDPVVAAGVLRQDGKRLLVETLI